MCSDIHVEMLLTLFAASGYLSNCGLQPVHSFPFDPWLPVKTLEMVMMLWKSQ